MNNFKIYELPHNFDPNYRHVLNFENESTQQEYFNFYMTHEIVTAKFVGAHSDTVIVQLPYAQCLEYRYCSYTNETEGHSRTYYAFILNVEYNAPNRTVLTIAVDIWQTYMWDFNLSECFVDRMHCDRYDANLDPIFNLNPEHLEAGSDTFLTLTKKVVSDRTPNYECLCVIVDMTEPYGADRPQPSVNVLPTTMYHYCCIVKRADFQGMGVAGNSVVTRYSSLQYLIQQVGKSAACTGIRILPYIPFDYTFDNGNVNITGASYQAQYNQDNTYYGIAYLENVPPNLVAICSLDREDLIKYAKPNPSSLGTLASSNLEPKLFTYPFTQVSISNQQNPPLTLKPEYIPANMSVHYTAALGIVTTDRLAIHGYKGDGSSLYNNVINKTNNELTILNDQFANYISQNKASAINGVAVPIASGLLSMATGGISDAFSTNAKGQNDANTQMRGLRGSFGYISSAVGLASNIAGHLTQRSNLQNAPDTIKSSGNNVNFDVIADNLFYNVTVWRAHPEFLQRAWHVFNRTGYNVSDYLVPDINSRLIFNYLKCVEVNLISNLNQDIQQAIKQIFTNGVTVWHFRDGRSIPIGEMFKYTYDNIEMSLVGDNGKIKKQHNSKIAKRHSHTYRLANEEVDEYGYINI